MRISLPMYLPSTRLSSGSAVLRLLVEHSGICNPIWYHPAKVRDTLVYLIPFESSWSLSADFVHATSGFPLQLILFSCHQIWTDGGSFNSGSISSKFLSATASFPSGIWGRALGSFNPYIGVYFFLLGDTPSGESLAGNHLKLLVRILIGSQLSCNWGFLDCFWEENESLPHPLDP